MRAYCWRISIEDPLVIFTVFSTNRQDFSFSINDIVAVESDLKAMLPGMQAYTHTIAKL